MIKYLLDTNAIIVLLNNKNSVLTNRIKEHVPSEICISSIVAHELFYGAFKSQHARRNVHLIDNLQFEVLEFDKEDARHSGEIRAVLGQHGKPIGPYDVLLAGQAKSRGLVLITHNMKEFSRIKGLIIEDWEL